MAEALQTEHLYLRRGRFFVCDVNLRLAERETIAVEGRGGAGKSTLIRGIGGALIPEAGIIRYRGKELSEDEKTIRRQMSVVYDEPNFNTELKPARLVRELMKFEPFFDREAFFSYLEQFELKPDVRVKLYSTGMQKELMLALALSRRPSLLVMDEPTSGVDQPSRKLMWQIIDDYRKDHELALLYTTHHEEELAFADRVCRMEHGSCIPGAGEDGV